MKRRKDFFSKGVVIYAVYFFLVYRTLFQLSYVHEHSDLSYWAVGLIVFHIVGLIWCLGACLFYLMPRQFLSFTCAASLVVALEFLYPDPTKVHFWLHKREFSARVSAAQAAADGRLSIVLYENAVYIPSMPGGYCARQKFSMTTAATPISFLGRNTIGCRFQRIDDIFICDNPRCG